MNKNSALRNQQENIVINVVNASTLQEISSNGEVIVEGENADILIEQPLTAKSLSVNANNISAEAITTDEKINITVENDIVLNGNVVSNGVIDTLVDDSILLSGNTLTANNGSNIIADNGPLDIFINDQMNVNTLEGDVVNITSLVNGFTNSVVVTGNINSKVGDTNIVGNTLDIAGDINSNGSVLLTSLSIDDDTSTVNSISTENTLTLNAKNDFVVDGNVTANAITADVKELTTNGTIETASNVDILSLIHI